MFTQRFYSDHQLDDTVARQAGFNPYYPLIRSGLDDPVVIGAQGFIDLASNNYLGLANDSRVKDAAIRGIREYGVSLCATPIASGYTELFHKVETLLSEFTGLEDTVIFPSCYQANNGLFPVITRPDDLVIVDRNAHSSLLEGIRSSGCHYRLFRHNDIDHLETLLKRVKRKGQIFVVTESVFSTEGDIAHFDQIVALCKGYDAIPVIDDSHGIGVLGPEGRGILSYYDITDYDGIYTASLGKAIASTGGMISGKASLIRYLRFTVSHLIYSTAILPAPLMALMEVLRIIREEFDTLSGKTWEYAGKIRVGLLNSGLNIVEGRAPINSIRSGNSLETLQMAKLFYDAGILTTPFIYPSVPEKEGRIRLIAGANLKESSIGQVLDFLSQMQTVEA